MVEPKPILIPLLNPNEVDALLAELSIVEGQSVREGDQLASLETTKSSAELCAEGSGFIVGLRFAEGDTVRAGDILAYIAERPGDLPEVMPPEKERKRTDSALPEGLRITQPALALAREANLDLAKLPLGKLVTETLVRSLLPSGSVGRKPSQPAFDTTAIVVYGGGGHGKSVIDLLRALGIYTIVGVVDDGLTPGSTVLGVSVLGGAEQLPSLVEKGCRLAVNAVGGIGNAAVRVSVFDHLAEAGMVCPAVVHPTAYVEPSARLSAGVQVFPHAYVGSDASVGYGVIVNTGAIVSHDCVLGDYANISPGAMLAGGVSLGNRVLVGMGATINLEASLGDGARIGNGATVKSSVPAGRLIRAGSIWPGD